MSATAVFCIVHSEEQAVSVVAELRQHRVEAQDISALFVDNETTRYFDFDHGREDPSLLLQTCGLVGGILGMLDRPGMLHPPGMEPLIVSGPLLESFSLSPLPPDSGKRGIAATLQALGVAPGHAQRMEGLLNQGDILLAVHSHRPGDLAEARGLFQRAEARSICMARMKKRVTPHGDPMS